jgi:hypothetical protein
MFAKSKKSLRTVVKTIVIAVAAVAFAIAVYTVSSLASYGFDVDLWSAGKNANKYLSSLESLNYRAAFSCLYLYEGDIDSPYDGKRADAFNLWKSRVKAHADVEEYLKDYFNLTIEKNKDGSIVGSVVITLYQQGREMTYETNIVFVKQGNGYKIADISTESVKTFYESDVSGNMSAE